MNKSTSSVSRPVFNGNGRTQRERPATRPTKEGAVRDSRAPNGQTIWSHTRENVLVHSGGLRSAVTVHIRTAIIAKLGGHALRVEIHIFGNPADPKHMTLNFGMEYPQPSLLEAYRYHQLLTAIPYLPLDGVHLQELFALMCGKADCLSSKRVRRMERRFGEQLRVVQSMVPSAESMLQALAQAHEFQVPILTESLTRLAAEEGNAFEITPELMQSGVESVESYRQRQLEIDEMFVRIGGPLAMICARFGQTAKEYKPVVAYLIGKGIVGRNLCLAYVLSVVFHNAMRQDDPLGLEYGMEDAVSQAADIVSSERGWGAAKTVRLEREVLGLIQQLS